MTNNASPSADALATMNGMGPFDFPGTVMAHYLFTRPWFLPITLLLNKLRPFTNDHQPAASDRTRFCNINLCSIR